MLPTVPLNQPNIPTQKKPKNNNKIPNDIDPNLLPVFLFIGALKFSIAKRIHHRPKHCINILMIIMSILTTLPNLKSGV